VALEVVLALPAALARVVEQVCQEAVAPAEAVAVAGPLGKVAVWVRWGTLEPWTVCRAQAPRHRLVYHALAAVARALPAVRVCPGVARVLQEARVRLGVARELAVAIIRLGATGN